MGIPIYLVSLSVTCTYMYNYDLYIKVAWPEMKALVNFPGKAVHYLSCQYFLWYLTLCISHSLYNNFNYPCLVNNMQLDMLHHKTFYSKECLWRYLLGVGWYYICDAPSKNLPQLYYDLTSKDASK